MVGFGPVKYQSQVVGFGDVAFLVVQIFIYGGLKENTLLLPSVELKSYLVLLPIYCCLEILIILAKNNVLFQFIERAWPSSRFLSAFINYVTLMNTE
jgi:hypothetical protein